MLTCFIIAVNTARFSPPPFLIIVSIYYMEFIYLMTVQLTATFTFALGFCLCRMLLSFSTLKQQFVVIHEEASATFTVSVFYAFLGNTIILGYMM